MCHQSPLSLLMSPLTSYKGSHWPGWTDEHYRPGQLTPPLSLLYIVCDMWRGHHVPGISWPHARMAPPGIPVPWQPSSLRAITRQFSPNLIFKSPPAPPVWLGWKLAGVLAGHYARLAIQIVPRVRLTAAITVRAGFRDQSFDTIKT